jgi:hypothetical protein
LDDGPDLLEINPQLHISVRMDGGIKILGKQRGVDPRGFPRPRELGHDLFETACLGTVGLRLCFCIDGHGVSGRRIEDSGTRLLGRTGVWWTGLRYALLPRSTLTAPMVVVLLAFWDGEWSSDRVAMGGI